MEQLSGLTWGVMSRFREYVSTLEDGEEIWNNSCDRDEFFPLEGITAVTGGDEFRFSGYVRFWGYSGLLDVNLSGFCFLVSRGEVQVTVDSAPPGVMERRVPFASAGRMSRDQGSDTVLVSGLKLGDQGAKLLGSVYKVGEPLDDAVISLSS